MSTLSDVLVLAGGLDYERDVSLRSGRRVVDALRHVGVRAQMADVDESLVPRLIDSPPDAVFLALHGAAGEDGAVRGVLELLDVPYAGTTSAAARLSWDKPSAKLTAREAGLDTPEWVALPHSTFRELGAQRVMERIIERLGLPLMVKPAQGGSSLGCDIVEAPDELPRAMIGCFAYGNVALVERFVRGTEVAISIIETDDGPAALPAVEIAANDGAYDYTARYTAGMTSYHVPARLDDESSERVSRFAVAAHRALHLRDFSRVDAIVDHAGRPQFLEVDISPGVTDTSLFPMAVEASGRDLGEVCRQLLMRAVDRYATVGSDDEPDIA
jgi:D-alanine-D-alanine ligase